MTSLHDECRKDEVCDGSHPGATKDWESGDPTKGHDITVSLKGQGHVIPKADRYNDGKVPLHYMLIFPTANEAFSRVKEMGALKYDYLNCIKGGRTWDETLDSALRHLQRYVEYMVFIATGINIAPDGRKPNYYDPETGCAHLAHADWNIQFLQECCHKGMTYDPDTFAKMAKFLAEREWAQSGQ